MNHVDAPISARLGHLLGRPAALLEQRSAGRNPRLLHPVEARPGSPQFKEDIIQAFYDGIKHEPDTTFDNVKADVVADEDPRFVHGNFCQAIRHSPWSA